VKHSLLALLGAAALLAATAPALACPAGGCPPAAPATPAGAEAAAAPHGKAAARRRAPPRIIFGETEETDFQFRERRPLRRSAASTRQAYFGSGELYSSTLSRLQAQMQAIKARAQLERLALTPAQEAAKEEMAPALMRALSLSKQARETAAN
jgi:hypothetical protein